MLRLLLKVTKLTTVHNKWSKIKLKKILFWGNSWVFEYLLGYLLETNSSAFYHMLTTLDQFGQFVTSFVLLWLVFSNERKIWMLNYSNEWPAYKMYINNCGFSSVCIYSDRCLVKSWASKYFESLFDQLLDIQIYSDIFWSSFWHQNIFRYLFETISWYLLITVLRVGW